MKIQFMSDLHLELSDNSRYIKDLEIPVAGDVLVLAGDTAYLRDSTMPNMKFWKCRITSYNVCYTKLLRVFIVYHTNRTIAFILLGELASHLG